MTAPDTITQALHGIAAGLLAEQQAKAQTGVYREQLDQAFRDRYDETGERLTRTIDDVVTVRLDRPAAPVAAVSDAATLTGYMTEFYPSEVAATITVDAADLDAALGALRFAGIEATPKRETRPAFVNTWLRGLTTDSDGTCSEVDPATGEVRAVPGVTAQPGGPARLVVSLAPGARQAALAAGRAAAQLPHLGDLEHVAELDSAEPPPVTADTGDEQEKPDPTDSPTDPAATERHLNGLTVAELRKIGKEYGITGLRVKAPLVDAIRAAQAGDPEGEQR